MLTSHWLRFMVGRTVRAHSASVLTEGPDFEHRAVRHLCFSKDRVAIGLFKTEVYMSRDFNQLPQGNFRDAVESSTFAVADEIKTVTHPFGACSTDEKAFFCVQEGLAWEDTLVQVSLLLKCAEETAYEMCDGPDRSQRGLLWSTLHSIEGAKGLVDALLNGASRADRFCGSSTR